IVFKTVTGPFKPAALDKTPHEAPFGMLISPIVLAAAVILFFFIPNWLAHTSLEPIMRVALPGLLATGERFDVHISPWHGWNTELLMTIGIVAIGSLMFTRLSLILGFYDYLP